MTPRERAIVAARIAAYGRPDIRTPADWTLLEALQAMRQQDNNMQVSKKRKRHEKESAIVNDGVLGPIFENV